MLFVLIITTYCGVGFAYAATTDYSNVLFDLTKDPEFNTEEYPAIDDDYSLQVIQIAEGSEGELFVYVYQPAAKTVLLTATSLNMSLTESVDDTMLYQLSLISADGVFQKYLVDDVSVSSNEIRYYNITSIYREWVNELDGNTENVSEKAFEIAQLWKAETDENGYVSYNMTTTTVLEITDTYSSFIRYRSGYWYIWGDATDSHYIAFSTENYNIDRLFEAKVYFEQRSVTCHYAGGSGHYTYRYGSLKSKIVTLSEIDEGHVKITGIGGIQHSWERIQSVSDFINSESSLSSSNKNALSDKQWVLRFSETEYTKSQDIIGNYDEDYTEVKNITILQLYFETDGRFYNLGVVSNKIQEDPPKKDHNEFNLFKYIWHCLVAFFTGTATFEEIIVAIITIIIGLVLLPLLIFLLSLLVPLFKTIFKGIWTGIKYLFIGLWGVISLPVRLIIWIVRKIKGEY